MAWINVIIFGQGLYFCIVAHNICVVVATDTDPMTRGSVITCMT